MKLYLRFILSLFLAFTSCQPAFALTKVDGSLLKGDVIGGTASNTRRIVVPKDTKANLDAKTRLEANLVYGTDTKKAYIDNGTSLVAVGSGSGGAVNLITDGDAENATSSIFVPYDDVGVAFPIDGTGGSPTVTTSITSTNPLTGAKSYLLTKPASVVQGQGWAIPFTVDPSYRAKVLKISVDYIVNSGTFTAGSSLTYSDIIWYIYDITNSTLIEPSSTKMLSNSSTLSDKFEATFQTSATGSSYRLIAHMATGFLTAFELKVDNVTVSPSAYVYGTPITDFVLQSTAPVITGSSSGTLNIGTGGGATNTVEVARFGSEISARYTLRIGTTGATDVVGALQLPLPLGYTTSLVNFDVIGYGEISVIGSANPATRLVAKLFNNKIVLDNSDSAILSAGGSYFSNANSLSVVIKFKANGLSSSVQMSDSADTRVVAAYATLTSSSSAASGSWLDITTFVTQKDTHGAFSAGTNYTVPSAGWYKISGVVRFAANATGIRSCRIAVDGTAQDATGGHAGYAGDDNFCNLSYLLYLNYGQVIKVQAYQNSGGALSLTSGTRFSIEKIQGPSAIAASESVNCSYSLSATQSAAHNVTTTVVFNNKIFDTHGALNPSTGIFTAPIAGKYRVSGRVRASIGTGVSYTQQAVITTTGTGGGLSDIGAVSPAGFSVFPTTNITETISLNAGQTVKIDFYHFNSASAAVTIQTNSNISIERIGN